MTLPAWGRIADQNCLAFSRAQLSRNFILFYTVQQWMKVHVRSLVPTIYLLVTPVFVHSERNRKNLSIKWQICGAWVHRLTCMPWPGVRGIFWVELCQWDSRTLIIIKTKFIKLFVFYPCCRFICHSCLPYPMKEPETLLLSLLTVFKVGLWGSFTSKCLVLSENCTSHVYIAHTAHTSYY